MARNVTPLLFEGRLIEEVCERMKLYFECCLMMYCSVPFLLIFFIFNVFYTCYIILLVYAAMLNTNLYYYCKYL